MMIKDEDNEKFKFLTGVGLVIAHISMFFILEDPKNIKQDDHYDLDIRLSLLFTKLNITNKSKDLSLKHFACFCLEMFCNYWKIQKIENGVFQNADELFKSYLKCFEKYKETI